MIANNFSNFSSISNQSVSFIKKGFSSNFDTHKKKFYLIAAFIFCYTVGCFYIIKKTTSINKKLEDKEVDYDIEISEPKKVLTLQFKVDLTPINSSSEFEKKKSNVVNPNSDNIGMKVPKVKQLEKVKDPLAQAKIDSIKNVEPPIITLSPKLQLPKVKLKTGDLPVGAPIMEKPKIPLIPKNPEVDLTKAYTVIEPYLTEKYKIKIIKAKEFDNPSYALKQWEATTKIVGIQYQKTVFDELDYLAVQKIDGAIVGCLRFVKNPENELWFSEDYIAEQFKYSSEKLELRYMLQALKIAHQGGHKFTREICQNDQLAKLCDGFNKFNIPVTKTSSIDGLNRQWTTLKYDLTKFNIEDTSKILNM